MTADHISADNLEPGLGPRAKIERAKEHLAELDREISAFVDTEPYTFRVHADPDGTQHIILDSRKPVPVRWSTIVGDIIHNARSALDLLITHAVSREAGALKEVDFRIYRHRADFEKKGFQEIREELPANCPVHRASEAI